MLLLSVEGWQGWYFNDTGDFCDPAGNRYRPADFQATFWMRQAWEDRAGHPARIRYLHEHLRQLVKLASQPGGYVVEIRKESPQGLILLQSVRLA